MIKQTSLLFFIIIIKLTSLLYASGKNDSSYHQLDPLQVKAKAIEGKVITITEIEADIGKHEDVNHLVYMNPGIQRVPETGSQLLVNGGSIYDNQYYLNNIPMFIPAHFSGHYIFDINSLLVPSLQNFNLILHTISGNFAGASNSVILVEPGIFTVNNKNPRHRPEVLLTLATYDAGICISTPFRKGKHHYQVTANFPNSFFIKFKNERDNSFIWWDIPYYSNKNPLWYEDITFTGKSEFKNCVLKEHFWLALDAYNTLQNEEKSIIPWGCGSVVLEGIGNKNKWEITAGGSRQYDRQRKIYSTVVHENSIEHTNAAIFGKVENISLGTFLFDFNIRGEYATWYGNSCKYEKEENKIDNIVTGDEIKASMHTGVENGSDKFLYGIDILYGGKVYKKYSLFVDPGIWGKCILNEGYLSLNGGIQTAWPDIRGFPDEDYRFKEIKTYNGSLVFQKALSPKFEMLLQSSIRWKNHCPAFSDNVYTLQWYPEKATPLLSGGISGELTFKANKFISTQLIFDFTKSKRKENDTYTTYEWDIPWSLRPLIQFHLRENTFNLYFSGVFAEGLPYRELINGNDELQFAANLKRTPWYRRVDVKFQFEQPIEDHRFFTGFSIFIDAINVGDILNNFRQNKTDYWKNVREYYWNEFMVKKPVNLERSAVRAGVRASFKLQLFFNTIFRLKKISQNARTTPETLNLPLPPAGNESIHMT